jgi:hypothetical protein
VGAALIGVETNILRVVGVGYGYEKAMLNCVRLRGSAGGWARLAPESAVVRA